MYSFHSIHLYSELYRPFRSRIPAMRHFHVSYNHGSQLNSQLNLLYTPHLKYLINKLVYNVYRRSKVNLRTSIHILLYNIHIPTFAYTLTSIIITSNSFVMNVVNSIIIHSIIHANHFVTTLHTQQFPTLIIITACIH